MHPQKHPDVKPWPEGKPTMSEVLCGNADAVRFCTSLLEIVHLWDDLIDRDVPVEDASIDRAFRMALVDLPSNPFFARFASVLCPVIASSIHSWHASRAMESGRDREAWNKAHTLRVQGVAAIAMCAELVGGYEWGVKMAPYIHDIAQDETLSRYIEELEKRHAADPNQA